MASENTITHYQHQQLVDRLDRMAHLILTAEDNAIKDPMELAQALGSLEYLIWEQRFALGLPQIRRREEPGK